MPCCKIASTFHRFLYPIASSFCLRLGAAFTPDLALAPLFLAGFPGRAASERVWRIQVRPCIHTYAEPIYKLAAKPASNSQQTEGHHSNNKGGRIEQVWFTYA
jgi:hypothetical protein